MALSWTAFLWMALRLRGTRVARRADGSLLEASGVPHGRGKAER